VKINHKRIPGFNSFVAIDKSLQTIVNFLGKEQGKMFIYVRFDSLGLNLIKIQPTSISCSVPHRSAQFRQKPEKSSPEISVIYD
jgi:hypothetical protein